ncbi:MAG: lipid II flippase MurJ [bacterium]
MKRLLTRTKDFVFAQQTGILSSALVISSMLLLARIFGLMRFRVMNNYFSKEELALYLAAFRIPDFVFELLISGALSTTFIPFFQSFGSDKKKQSRVISSLISVICFMLVFLVLILYITMPQVVKLTVIGFNDAELLEVTRLSRILLVAQLPFLVLGNILTGLSQAYKRFLLPAFAPVIYNIGIVGSTIILAPQFHLDAVIIGVVVGSALFFASQLPALFTLDFQLYPTFTFAKEVYSFFKTITPRILTVLAAQIEATIDQTLSTLISTGAYTIFYFAQHLQLLPVSIIGMAFGQASLPYLAEMYQSDRISELKKVITDSLSNMFFVMMPVMLFFVVSRTPLVRLIYGGQRFDWTGTVLTAETMSFFALSIPFHSCYYFLTRCFYAAQNSRTPFIVSICSIAFNAILSYIAVGYMELPVWSLGLTFSFTIILQTLTLIFLLHIQLGGLLLMSFLKEFAKISVAVLMALVVMYPSQRILDGLIFDTTRTINLVLLMLSTGTIMTTVYLLACWLLDASGLFLITRLLSKVGILKKDDIHELLPVQ